MDREAVAEHAEVFDAVADPTRLGVLLGIIRRSAREGPLSYSDAMEAAGFDDSGHFNYHLERLRGDFVTETDGRYYPTAGAWELHTLIGQDRLGSHDADAREATAGGACLRCGSPLVARFDQYFSVRCPDCETQLFTHTVGPDVVADADLRTLAHEVDATARDEIRLFVERRCPYCNGESGAYFSETMPAVEERDEIDVLLGAGCTNCVSGQPDITVGQLLLGHPRVQDYCDDHGIDLYERPQWEYEWTRTDATTVVESKDPWRVRKYAVVDGCRLVVTLEDGGAVSRIDHVSVAGADDTTG